MASRFFYPIFFINLLSELVGQPEMEMVARGLEKNLNVEQREHLIKMLAGVCSEESYRSAAEALGLVFYPLPFSLNYFLQNHQLTAFTSSLVFLS